VPRNNECENESKEKIQQKVSSMFENPWNENVASFFKFCEENGFRFYSVEADHCFDAYSGVLQHGENWKILYSGDTRPTQNLINYGRDATLLIHEATNEDDHKKEATENFHTVTSDAIAQGVQMNCWRTVLTHFSPWYD